MFSESAKALDRVFRALASAPRREILRLAAREKCTVTQFVTQLKMNEPAVSKHVRVLVDAALLSKTRKGRFRWCRSRRSAFGPARECIEKLCGMIAGSPKKAMRAVESRRNNDDVTFEKLSDAIALKRLKG